MELTTRTHFALIVENSAGRFGVSGSVFSDRPELQTKRGRSFLRIADQYSNCPISSRIDKRPPLAAIERLWQIRAFGTGISTADIESLTFAVD